MGLRTLRRAASADISLGSGVSLLTGGPGYGAPLQWQVRAPGLGSQELPGQCPAAGQGLIPEPQQGCVQQVSWQPGRGLGGAGMVPASLPARPACSEYYHFRQAWIPLRWMPPEAVLEDEFSTKSDVWSFGVLMWEVFMQGELPYTSMADDEVLAGMWSASAVPSAASASSWCAGGSQPGWAQQVQSQHSSGGKLPSPPHWLLSSSFPRCWSGWGAVPAHVERCCPGTLRRASPSSQPPFGLCFLVRSAVGQDEAPAARGLPFPPGQADAALLGTQPQGPPLLQRACRRPGGQPS